MSTYFECWSSVAAALFSQALAGEPELIEALPKPMAEGTFGFAATITGEEEGRFSVVLERGVLDTPFLGEGADQQASWGELLREVAEAAVGELLAKTGRKCRVEGFEEIVSVSPVSRAFQLKSAGGTWSIVVRDETRLKKVEAAVPQKPAEAAAGPEPVMQPARPAASQGASLGVSPGVELLLDVELEATLRFGCRELPLSEILDLGPGDVVELDRHIADPVDLIVGDKIVARGEVVLVNGNFGLRVTEVAEPRKRLESIRCLF